MMKTPFSRKVLSVKELAEYLGIHSSSVYRLVARNALPAFKVGSDWRFNIEEIDAWRLQKEKR